MSLFQSELSRYANLIESSLQNTIPNTLTNYGEFLEKYPPAQDAAIIENSAWWTLKT